MTCTFSDVNERVMQLYSSCKRNKKSEAETCKMLFKNYSICSTWKKVSWNTSVDSVDIMMLTRKIKDWFLGKGMKPSTDDPSFIQLLLSVREGCLMLYAPPGAPFIQNQDLFAEYLTWKQIYCFLAASFVKMYMYPAKSNMQSVPGRHFVYFCILTCV